MRKHLFQDFFYLLNFTTLICSSNRQNFRRVGLFASVLCAGDVAPCGASDRAIQIAIVNSQLSKGVHGARLLGDDSFYNI